MAVPVELDLEGHGRAGFLLDHSRSGFDAVAYRDVSDPNGDAITTPQFAVYREVEHRQVPDAPFHLQARSESPDMLRLQRWFWTNDAARLPGAPLHLSRRLGEHDYLPITSRIRAMVTGEGADGQQELLGSPLKLRAFEVGSAPRENLARCLVADIRPRALSRCWVWA